jgi:autotransporter-associated beta strand protein
MGFMAAAIILSGQEAQADDLTWVGGSNFWNNPGAWDPAIVPLAGDTARFPGTLFNDGINLSGQSHFISRLILEGGTGNRYGFFNGSLVFSDGGQIQTGRVDIPGATSAFLNDASLILTGAVNFDIAAGNQAGLRVEGGIAGAGSLNKTGAGVLEITGPTSYTGGTTISAGTISINDAGSLGTGPVVLSGGA